MTLTKYERFADDLPELFRWPEWTRLATLEDRMRLEEFTDDGTLVIRAEMPGIDPEKDVDISMSDGLLTIRAERREETKTEERNGYHSEFHYGAFSRSMRLPSGASEKDVKATYKDGILEVRVPIDKEQAAAKKVPVEKA
jgi:HSP20 family protein